MPLVQKAGSLLADRRLRGGVSVAALVLAAGLGAAPAQGKGLPTPFSADWFAQKSTQSPSAAGTPTAMMGGVLLTDPQLRAKAAQTLQDLTAAANAIADAQAVQAAARAKALAAPSTVPNGLTAGGLVVAPGVAKDPNLWINAQAPTQTQSGGETVVTVNQTAAQAVLTWSSFNVGKSTELVFNQQGNAGWVALNRVLDPNAVPSQIAGTIKADGTVLIIDRNGVLFDGSAQVNVHSLVASSLDLYTVFDSAGNAANYDASNINFATNGLFVPVTMIGSTLTDPEAVAFVAPAGKTAPGDITVAPGAEIITSLGASDNGGYVALLGANVTNGGNIATPSGQIILAATTRTVLEASSGDSTTRGFLVGAGAVTSTQFSGIPPGATIAQGTEATNQAGGLLSAPAGNITIAADTIVQDGVAAASTSITRNGSITLEPNQSGLGITPQANTVTLGTGSVTTILPDENGESIPTGSASTFELPAIGISANNVDIAAGSLIEAPGATFTISQASPITAGANGTVYLAPGSIIDLSGLIDVTLPMSANLVTFTPRGNEFADNPLLRDSFLSGQPVTVDIRASGVTWDGQQWVGSPILDASGYIANISLALDQLLTAGGSFVVGQSANGTSFADFIQAKGSTINLSGGWTTYQAGYIDTTRLVGADGHLYSISDANPLIGYLGFAGDFSVAHPAWGVTSTYQSSLIAGGALWQPGYIAGADAGAISITAETPVLEGSIVANTVVGTRQRALAELGSAADAVVTGDQRHLQTTTDDLPVGALLAINGLVSLQENPADVLGPDFTFGSSLPANLVAPLSTAALSADDLGEISINTRYVSGGVLPPDEPPLVLPDGATLSVQAGGAIVLKNVDTIAGTLIAHGGSISITGEIPYDFQVGPDAANVVIASTAVLDASGLWQNDAGRTGDAIGGALFINGGSVSISTLAHSVDIGSGNNFDFVDATQGIQLDAGSVIDVSSGGYVTDKAALAIGSNGLPLGQGGSVSLVTYAAPTGGQIWQAVPTDGSTPGVNTAPTGPNAPTAATVALDGTILAQGFDGGGTFHLQVPAIQIGGSAPAQGYVSELPASFFAGVGFSTYALTSVYGGITVAADTTLALHQSSYLADSILELQDQATLAAEASEPSGALVRDFEATGLLPEGIRPAVNLSLVQVPYDYGAAGDASTAAGITIDAGARILADPQAAITLVGGGPVVVLGSIVAPGGSITAVNANSVLGNQGQGEQVLWLGAQSSLDVAGTVLVNPLIASHLGGTVLPGGSITLGSEAGDLVVEQGAVLDIAGASGELQVAAGEQGFKPIFATTELWSDGGSLAIGGATNGAGAAYLAGTILAAGGAPEANGGSLAIGGVTLSGAAATLDLGGFSDLGAIVLQQGGNVAAGLSLTGPLPAGSYSAAYVTADTLNASGLSSVTLQTTLGGGPGIAFSGPVSLSVKGDLLLGALTISDLAAGNLNPTLAAGPGTVPSIGAPVVQLSADYIALMGGEAATAAPGLADGTLDLTAQQIDVSGVVQIANVETTRFTSSGDIRFLPGDFNPDFGSSAQKSGALIVAGALDLAARQVYAASATTFMVQSLGTRPGTDSITISSTGSAGLPLSAGSDLVLDARSLVQGGTVVAPLGTIQLGVSGASDIPALIEDLFAGATGYGTDPTTGLGLATVIDTATVKLAPGSVTSVSAAGLIIPYGSTVDDQNWYYGTQTIAGVTSQNVLTAPPSKNLHISGQSIDIASGATVDARGGGDVYATEFVPGTGGTRDVLATDNSAGTPQFLGGVTVYALVPGYVSTAAPYDPNFRDTFGDSVVTPGTAVYLSGGNGIPAGIYTLMPGHYATLPGAYRVMAVSGTTDALAANNFTTLDGSQFISGYMVDSLTGTRSARSLLFEVESNAVWRQYSEIDTNYANTYFTALAATDNTVVPRLPMDAGTLALSATRALSLQGEMDFQAADGGRGGRVDISAQDIAVVAPGQAAPAGYLAISADQISNLGVESVLLGGYRIDTTTGTDIIATANSLVIDTDAAHPLTAPDLLLVATPELKPIGPDTPYIVVDNAGDKVYIPQIVAGTGRITIDPGSVIRAVGSVSAGEPTTLILGSLGAQLPTSLLESLIQSWSFDANGVSAVNPITQYYEAVLGSGAMGTLLRVSNGGNVLVERAGLPDGALPSITVTDDVGGTGPYTITPRPLPAEAGGLAVDAGAVIDGGNAFTLDTHGEATISAGATLVADNFTLASGSINIGAAPAGTGGLEVSSALLAQLQGAQTITLRSATSFDFYGNAVLDDAASGATLVLDGGGIAGFGGSATIEAATIRLLNSFGVAAGAGSSADGSLTLDAATIIEDYGQKTLSGFGRVAMNASARLVVTGAGGLDAGAARLLFDTPDLVVARGTNVAEPGLNLPVVSLTTQSITTTGALDITASGAAGSAAAYGIGGALTLTAGSIDENGLITARSGQLTLDATSGNVVIGAAGHIDASGPGLAFFDLTTDAPGGTVKLVAEKGNLLIEGGTIDVGATGTAAAGTLSLTTAASGTASLDGTLLGSASKPDLGGSFVLDTGSFTGALPTSFGGSVSVTTHNGDIDIAQTLTSANVLLQADGGAVVVTGTIDANGTTGGSIALYGETGVTIGSTARLEAEAVGADGTTWRTGGSITLGTVGQAGTGLNQDGSETMVSSGVIDVQNGAVLDVSGPEGGTVTVRAPILATNNVDVSFGGTVRGAREVILSAYEVWSTDDKSTGAQHFTGVIDPAAAGALGQFYTSTLVGFVENPFDGNDAAVRADFTYGGSPAVLLRPEIDLVNPDKAINDGNITVKSNWNFGAGSLDNGVPSLVYRTTDGGQPGTLALRAVNDVQVDATISDGFFFYNGSTDGNAIANDPTASTPNTTTAADLMTARFGDSFSYLFAAGADFSAVDPNATVPGGSGNFTIDGHTSYQSPAYYTIVVPTVLRTGTGSITIDAAGNVQFLDSADKTPIDSPAIYTAGVAAALPKDFINFNAEGDAAAGASQDGERTPVVTAAVWGQNGGSVTVNAGQNIIGIEEPVDADGSQTQQTPGTLVGQFWSAWLFYAGALSTNPSVPYSVAGSGIQPREWVNYGSFAQGFGALGGGSIALSAGGNVQDVSASLPQTMQVSGGLVAGSAAVEHVYGGGNLSVEAGGDLLSSSFLVGQGAGRISLGGSATADVNVFDPNTLSSYSVPLVLAEQAGAISLAARGDVVLGTVLDPTAVVNNAGAFLANSGGWDKGLFLINGFSTPFVTYGAGSGVTLTSAAGDVMVGALTGAGMQTLLNDAYNTGTGFGSGQTTLYPASLTAVSLSGNLQVLQGDSEIRSTPILMVPSAIGTLDLLAGQSIDFQGAVDMLDYDPAQYYGPLTLRYAVAGGIDPTAIGPLLTQNTPFLHSIDPLHASDPNPAHIYALVDIVDGAGLPGLSDIPSDAESALIVLDKQASIEAGRDIVNLSFLGQNNNAANITSIIAGQDITGPFGQDTLTLGVSGPGTFYLDAGRNIGPFEPSGTGAFHGIIAYGNNFDPYLPAASANIDLLFGTGPGIDYQAFIQRFIDPATTPAGGTNYLPEVALDIDQLELALTGTDPQLTPAQAWTAFQALSPERQHLLVDQVFLLEAFAKNADGSPNAQRGYEALATLFPAAYGYTNDNTGLGVSGASTVVFHGSLDISHALLETQTGGDINIIGPGGGVLVGSNSRDNISPNGEGILTLQGGSIRSVTDQSVIVNQARIFTEQGGDIDLFSANGDLNAGKGPKTAASYPPLVVICDPDGYCRVDPAGLVTGAGIGALLTLPGQDPALSSVDLRAPRGTIDAGDAGIRVAGNLVVAALHVANASNISVGGHSNGVPTAPSVNLVAVSAASAAASAASNAAESGEDEERKKKAQRQRLPSIITVEVLGFGDSK